MKNSRPTIKDVAKACNVSIATVSRVLNKSSRGVGSETTARVLSAMQKLGYEPNILARGMVNGNTGLIGLVVPDIRNPFFSDLAKGVQDCCNKSGFNCLLCNTDSSETKEMQYIHFFEQNVTCGVVFTTQNNKENESGMLEFSKHGIPQCYIEKYVSSLPNVPGVFFQNRLGAEMIVEYLIARGHKRIVIITGPLETQNAKDRLAGYQDALKKAGIQFDESLVVEADYLYKGGFEAIQKIVKKDVQFTAVFASNDLMGYGALEYLYSIGKRIPTDYSIVGFDDIRYPEIFQPQITSITIPAYEMGFLAAQKVIGLINGNDNMVNRQVIGPHIVEKGSVMTL